MEEKEITRIKGLLVNAGFIDAKARFESKSEKQKDLIRKFIERHGQEVPVYDIDHYKLKNGFGIVVGKKKECPEITFKFNFFHIAPLGKRQYVMCHQDVSVFKNIRTVKELWEYIGNLFRQHVTPWWMQRIK